MTARDFENASRKVKPYVFDIDREVTDFYRGHPEQKDFVFFLYISSDAPFDFDTPSKNPSATARIIIKDGQDKNYILNCFRNNDDLKKRIGEAYTSGAITMPYPDKNYSWIIVNNFQQGLNILGQDTALDAMDVFSFDHEIGHALGHDGSGNDLNMKECIADAYAVIRHFQRFGTETGSIGHLIGLRAIEMLFAQDNGSHFSSPVIQQIFADKEKIDFSTLTPAETVSLARRYASVHAMHPVSVRRLSDSFTSFQGKEKWRKLMDGDARVFKELLDFVLKTEKPAEFKWGALAIHTLLDGQVLFNGIRLEFDAAGAARLRQTLDARERTFNRQKPFPGGNNLK